MIVIVKPHISKLKALARPFFTFVASKISKIVRKQKDKRLWGWGWSPGYADWNGYCIHSFD